ncbi:MAG TPA: fibronectin type III domain-containing protein [Chthoniobacterales bacterium]|nr:fibronectin type III domain-containing protein [Chthoniobacterales bacterium]
MSFTAHDSRRDPDPLSYLQPTYAMLPIRRSLLYLFLATRLTAVYLLAGEPNAPFVEEPEAPLNREPDAPLADGQDAAVAREPDAPLVINPDTPIDGDPNGPPVYDSATNFRFTLSYEATTSAGVYTMDNKLIKTLWRKKPLSPGTYYSTWRGDDDNYAGVPRGAYTFKLIAHNVRYVWDGLVGNTSTTGSAIQGPSHHAGAGFIQSMAVDGTNAFYAMGEQEGLPPVRRFNTDSPQAATTVLIANSSVGFSYVATDGVRVYMASKVVPNYAYSDSAFVTATNISDNSPAYFTHGTEVCYRDASGQCSPSDTKYNDRYPSCIDIWAAPTPTPTPSASGTPVPSPTPYLDDPTGLAVQRNGNILAVSHGGQNKIRLYDKIEGGELGTICVPNPGELAMTPSGDLWVISGPLGMSGTTIRRYTNLSSIPFNPTYVATISSPSVSAPVAIAVMPARSAMQSLPPLDSRPSGPIIGGGDDTPGDDCNVAEVLIVADGGTSQSLKAFRYHASDNSTPQCWTYPETPGGYATGGPDVTYDKFQFQVGNRANPVFRTALAATADSIWVGDGATSRLLHLNGADRSYVDHIMFLTHNLGGVADPVTPTRLIGDGWLEFQVDYTASDLSLESGGWSLQKNWAAGVPSNFFGGADEGIQEVTTLEGRVYGTITDFSIGQRKILVELPREPNTNLRICKDEAGNDLVLKNLPTAVDYEYSPDVSQAPSFESDGSLRYVRIAPNGDGRGRVTWYQRDLIGFNNHNDPIWGDEHMLASAPYVNEDPLCLEELPLRQTRHPITASGVLLAFDPTFQVNGSKVTFPTQGATVDWTRWRHLGGVALNRSDWSWKGALSVPTAPYGSVGSSDLGDFDIGDNPQYAGSLAMAQGRNVVYGYPGEFWRTKEASQWMHFFDNGLFVGQFGTTLDAGTRVRGEALPGFTGNSFFPSMVGVNGNAPSTTGETYLWADDKSRHSGVARWHLVGANAVQEFVGSGYGNAGGDEPVDLVPLPTSFPTGLTALPGNAQVSLAWQPVSGAASYDVKYSVVSGGPYTTLASVSGTSYTMSGLMNDTKYFFAVSVHGNPTNSNQATAVPFDRVGRAGRVRHTSPDEPFLVTNGTPGVGSGVGMSNLPAALGDLSRTRVGTLGYVIYNFTDDGSGATSPASFTTEKNLAPGITVTLEEGSAWVNVPFVKNQFEMWKTVNHVSTRILGHISAISSRAGTTGSIDINVNDNAVHYLTVVSPAHAAIARDFTVSITPQVNPNTTVSYTESDRDDEAYNRIFQFVFTGSIKLTIENRANDSACLQGLFLD